LDSRAISSRSARFIASARSMQRFVKLAKQRTGATHAGLVKNPRDYRWLGSDRWTACELLDSV
jgi:hypothetical protein